MTADASCAITKRITSFTIDDYQCAIYLPKQYDTRPDTYYPVTYLLGETNLAPSMQIVEKSFCPPFIVVGVEARTWENDFSPWVTPPLVKKSKPFTGGASAFLSLLQTKIKTYVDSHYRTLSSPKDTALAGYSLAGLTTLFALYTTNFANSFASMSGSLWYEGWIPFCEKQAASFENKCVSTSTAFHLYLSLGNTEKNSRHQLMCKVDDCTQQTIAILQKQMHLLPGTNTSIASCKENTKLENTQNILFFEYNDGGHFNNIEARIAKGLVWLNKHYVFPADYFIFTGAEQ